MTEVRILVESNISRAEIGKRDLNSKSGLIKAIFHKNASLKESIEKLVDTVVWSKDLLKLVELSCTS